MLADFSALGVPRLGCQVGDFPEEGCDAWFRTPGTQLSFTRRMGSSAYDLIANTRGIRVHATLETQASPAPLSAIVRPQGSPLMVTEKRVLMPTRGLLEIHGERHSLDRAVGGMDYSQGYPPRETAWRWGFLMGESEEGRPLAMNLVQGFNGQPECVVWLDGRSYPLGEGRFSFDPGVPTRPWTLRTEDGVDLTFEPSAVHRETHHLGWVSSRFLQPIGIYQGRIEIPGEGSIKVKNVPGVAEDQAVLWLRRTGGRRCGRCRLCRGEGYCCRCRCRCRCGWDGGLC